MRSLRDAFCLSKLAPNDIRGTNREPQACAFIARHVYFMYHESEIAIYRRMERKRETERGSLGGQLQQASGSRR